MDFIHTLSDTISASNGINPYPVNIDFAPGVDHISHQSDMWTLSKWNEDEVQFNRSHILDDIEKLQLEISNDLINDKVTSPRPEQFINTYNVITLIGLTESAKRDTGEVATSLTHNSIGTGTTSANESDTDLQTEDTGGSYARLGYAAAGQRKVASQTAKYGMLWNEFTVSAADVIITESGVHWHVSNASSIHARVTFTPFTISSGDLFVTQINELHQNG